MLRAAWIGPAEPTRSALPRPTPQGGAAQARQTNTLPFPSTTLRGVKRHREIRFDRSIEPRDEQDVPAAAAACPEDALSIRMA
jgi:ferredoxin